MVPYISGAIVLGWCVWFFFLRRRGSAASPSGDFSYLLIYDGSSYVLQRAARTPQDSIKVRGSEYPAGLCTRVADDAGLEVPLYVLAAEPVALADHRSLELARSSIVLGNLFKPGGDLVDLMKSAALAFVLAAACYSLWTSSSIAEVQTVTQTELRESFRQVNTRLDRVVPAPPGVAAPSLAPVGSPAPGGGQ